MFFSKMLQSNCFDADLVDTKSLQLVWHLHLYKLELRMINNQIKRQFTHCADLFKYGIILMRNLL